MGISMGIRDQRKHGCRMRAELLGGDGIWGKGLRKNVAHKAVSRHKTLEKRILSVLGE